MAGEEEEEEKGGGCGESDLTDLGVEAAATSIILAISVLRVDDSMSVSISCSQEYMSQRPSFPRTSISLRADKMWC